MRLVMLRHDDYKTRPVAGLSQGNCRKLTNPRRILTLVTVRWDQVPSPRSQRSNGSQPTDPSLNHDRRYGTVELPERFSTPGRGRRVFHSAESDSSDQVDWRKA